MPIHLLWGDDSAARDRAVTALIEEAIDPTWSSINLSRLDGSEAGQAQQALEEARTPPFGAGMRVVLLQRSPFCNACPSELADRFEAALELIPDSTQLVLTNPAKPDGRLRTTKALQNGSNRGSPANKNFNSQRSGMGPANANWWSAQPRIST
jgi:DNA polymerase-3 subunit delta